MVNKSSQKKKIPMIESNSRMSRIHLLHAFHVVCPPSPHVHANTKLEVALALSSTLVDQERTGCTRFCHVNIFSWDEFVLVDNKSVAVRVLFVSRLLVALHSCFLELSLHADRFPGFFPGFVEPFSFSSFSISSFQLKLARVDPLILKVHEPLGVPRQEALIAN